MDLFPCIVILPENLTALKSPKKKAETENSVTACTLCFHHTWK